MTNEEQTLQAWMVREFELQGKRLDAIEARQAIADARMDVMHGEVKRFSQVVDRLDALAESLEVVSRFVARGKRAWLKVAGYVGGLLLMIDVIARSLPKLHWPW